MEFIRTPPKWVENLLPEGAKEWGWWVILAFLALVLVLLVFAFGSKLLALFSGGGGKKSGKQEKNLEERLADYPPLKPSAGDRQLRVEGVPVRLRLVVVAPAGKDTEEIDQEEVPRLLEKVLTGLGEIYKGDRPRLRVWPVQLSYEGFTKHFHRNTIIPEEEGEPSRWVAVAGRAKLGKRQIMLGLALQAAKPTTVGRRTIDAHEWDTVLRVRVRD